MSDFIAPETQNEASAPTLSIPVPPPPSGHSGSGAGGGARVMMKNPQDGSQVSRADYMKALARAGWTRPQILAHVKEVTGDKTLRYQTVHQAVKDVIPAKKRGPVEDANATVPSVSADHATEEAAA
jgi:hypothetical protein